MASVAIPGRKAYLRSSSASSASTAQTLMAELLDYTLTVEESEIAVTNHDSSGWEESILGVIRWSWEASCNYLSTGAGQGALRQALIDGDANCFLTFQATTSVTAKKFQGKTRGLRFTLSTPTEGAITGTFSGKGTGKIVRTG